MSNAPKIRAKRKPHENVVEFYLVTSATPFCTVEAEFQPDDGDYVNIKGCTYKVIGKSFTVDHADSFTERGMRCNVFVKRGK